MDIGKNSILTYVTNMDLRKCIPKSKHDIDAIERAQLIGFPAISPIVSELIEWLQDANWPVAQKTADLLASGDLPILPAIRSVFNSSDNIWKFWVITLLVSQMRKSVVNELRFELDALAKLAPIDEDAQDVKSAAKAVLSTLLT